ncbi:MAG: class I SAM-dependent methyltransferase [Acetobacteraceae bacterium]|nr:class I SAM-dependent methyltransferase [Acetobacteraceae bacterium]
MSVGARYIPTSVGNPYRVRRFALCRPLIDRTLAERGRCVIVDLGGSLSYWTVCAPDLLDDERVALDLINLRHDPSERAALGAIKGQVRFLHGDARRLDDVADGAYDVLHSNSVIEHVGQWADMVAMAQEVSRVARLHYVQTPYWGFPMEPHFRAPFFHWLPEQWRARLLLRFHLNFGARPTDFSSAMAIVQSAALLDRRQFASLFPRSSIYSEIVRGFTKSLIAIGGEGMAPEPASNTRKLRVPSRVVP